MRSKHEIYEAARTIAVAVSQGWLNRLTPDARATVTGVIATLEWVQGDEKDSPVTQLLADLRREQAGAN